MGDMKKAEKLLHWGLGLSAVGLVCIFVAQLLPADRAGYLVMAAFAVWLPGIIVLWLAARLQRRADDQSKKAADRVIAAQFGRNLHKDASGLEIIADNLEKSDSFDALVAAAFIKQYLADTGRRN